MSIILDLRPEVEEMLRQAAARIGKPVEAYLLDLAERESAPKEPKPGVKDEPLAIRLARMQPEERRPYLAIGAAALEADYRNDPELTIPSQFDEPVYED